MDNDEPTCTGMTARWCPIHGDCDCPETNAIGDWDFTPRCPLHGDASNHAIDELLDFMSNPPAEYRADPTSDKAGPA